MPRPQIKYCGAPARNTPMPIHALGAPCFNATEILFQVGILRIINEFRKVKLNSFEFFRACFHNARRILPMLYFGMHHRVSCLNFRHGLALDYFSNSNALAKIRQHPAAHGRSDLV
ncbi:hypothetical protein JXA32_06770 [Candidatus Sumerlaeota bacterium]|nr:hypothetical protein [Candidatus Sumerlaeota bacterium]